jgi:hypothetical protein
MRKAIKAPSPAMMVAILALVLAVGGTAGAALKGKDKKQVKKIADSEISKKAPGLSVANAANSANSNNSNDSKALGGVPASGFVKGAGHTYFGSKNGSVSTNNNEVLSIPGVATILFDCAANGVDTTPKIRNDSGVSLSDIGQTQVLASSSLDPFGPAINIGATYTLAARQVGTTTVQLWDVASGKAATVTFSNVFCNYHASAITNQ